MVDTHAKLRRRRWIVALVVVVGTAGTGWGATWLYGVRRAQNTRKLLERAERAATAEDWDAATAAYRQYLKREHADVKALSAYAGRTRVRQTWSMCLIEDQESQVRFLWPSLAP